MATLSPADVKRWNPDAIHSVFQTAANRASTLQTLGDNLGQVHEKLSEWHGEAGDAFRVDLGKTRHDIDADGHESRQVAAAVSRAEADVRAVKAELDRIEQGAQPYDFTVTPDWRIDAGGAKVDNAKVVAQQQLQGLLDLCKLHAHTADQELADAIRSAVGEAPVGVAPTPLGAGQPNTLEDMLLPASPASARPGGDPAKGPAIPGEANVGGTLSLEDMLLGRTEPSDPGRSPGDPLELLSRIPPGANAVAAPPLKPAEIESFKALARQTMINDGVPPEQIEARLDAVVANTQQWLDAGAPKYVAPVGAKPPPPGFGEGFGDRWFAMENSLHDLTGQNGFGAMGDAWGGMAKGLASKAADMALYGPLAPINDATQEFKSFLDNPAYYMGGRTADGAIALPGMLFGPETLGLRAGIAEIDPYAGMTPPPSVATGLDHPTTYHKWSDSAAQDLFSAFVHGEPTTSLTQHLSDMVTHTFGDNPDRVVLGKWQGQDAGYIGEARANGGIFFDTGDSTWKAMAEGLNAQTEQAVVWPVNEHFLRTQMENQVGRIDYVLDTEKYTSLEHMMRERAGSYSAMEVEFLSKNAAAYGYERVGNSWVYVGGG